MKNIELQQRKKVSGHKVVLAPYNSVWSDLAKGISKGLFLLLKDNLEAVEHIGSTAIPGMSAKPVIDLIPIVRDLRVLERQKSLLATSGYVWQGALGIKGRRFCTMSSADGLRLVHLHFFKQHSPHIQRHLAFRDYLIVHSEAAKDYEEIKRKAAALFPNDSFSYNQQKSAWIKTIEKKATEWYRQKG